MYYMYCVQCRSELDENATFCTECGHKNDDVPTSYETRDKPLPINVNNSVKDSIRNNGRMLLLIAIPIHIVMLLTAPIIQFFGGTFAGSGIRLSVLDMALIRLNMEDMPQYDFWGMRIQQAGDGFFSGVFVTLIIIWIVLLGILSVLRERMNAVQTLSTTGVVMCVLFFLLVSISNEEILRVFGLNALFGITGTAVVTVTPFLWMKLALYGICANVAKEILKSESTKQPTHTSRTSTRAVRQTRHRRTHHD